MISTGEQKLYDLLNELGITYTRHEHPPVYTVEEAERYWANIKGVHCKNLFLRNNKGNRHFLAVLEHSKRIDLKQIGQKMGQGKLGFASEERLEKYLGLQAGAVSPFGLINDQNKEVVVLLDHDLVDGLVNFHPNVNTATITISGQDFKRFLDRCGNQIQYL